jgi:hypothetical protein
MLNLEDAGVETLKDVYEDPKLDVQMVGKGIG